MKIRSFKLSRQTVGGLPLFLPPTPCKCLTAVESGLELEILKWKTCGYVVHSYIFSNLVICEYSTQSFIEHDFANVAPFDGKFDGDFMFCY